MAAIPSETSLVTITVNEQEIQVPKGELIVESVKRLGLEIPIFCYHPRMKPVGMCRMCFVEVGFKGPDGTVKMMPKPQTGCTLPADQNMVIYTDTQKVRADRKGVLEFLLINHPLDCPICDRGGECPLQNNTLFYGPSTTRYIEVKRHLPKAFPLSRYVTLDLERCIQCGRCVRFTEEISGDAQLAFLFRGAQMQPRTFQLTDFDSKFSGNVIEICPVGALTSSEYRFRARPWDLETRPAICLECSNGCSTWFDYRVGTMVRINGRTNESVNEEWTCDKGKFGQDYLNNPTRLTQPLIREGDALREASWGEAYEFIFEAMEKSSGKSAALTGNKMSIEDLYLFKSVFAKRLGIRDYDSRWYKNLPNRNETVYARHGIFDVHSKITDFESAKRIFVFGNNIAEELPILFLRVRKAWLNNDAKIVVASHEPTEVDAFASVVLRYKRGSEIALLGGLTKLIIERVGGSSELLQAVQKLTPVETEKLTGVSQQDLMYASELLSERFLTVSARSLYNEDNAFDIVSALVNLCIAGKSEKGFNLFATQANEQASFEVGVIPDEDSKNTQQILESCAAGETKFLWLAECDPMTQYHDSHLAEKALENVNFLVVQDIDQTESFHYASVVLPSCAFSEKDGTYMNLERRVQKQNQIIMPKGMAKASWKIFSEISLRIKPETPPFNAKEVFEEICREHENFSPAKHENLEGEGVVLEQVGEESPKVQLIDYDYQEIKT